MKSLELPATVDWTKLGELVAHNSRFLLTSHVRPDADAIGSELAMGGVLRSLGKHVRIVNASPMPPRLVGLDPQRHVQTLGEDIPPAQLTDAEVVIILDTSSWQQLDAMGDAIRACPAKRAVIDHHLSADDLGADMFKDTSAAATGELVWQAAEHLGVNVTQEIAEPMFAAMATDTGWFRFGSANARTYHIAARLVDAGAQPAKLYRELYEQDSLARLKLMGLALERLQTAYQGRLAYTEVHRDDFQRTGAIPPDTEDLVNLALTIASVEVGLIFIEQLQGGVKVSFRSRNGVDCRLWAEKLGGGGHRQAAGAILNEPTPDVIAKVLAAMPASWNASP